MSIFLVIVGKHEKPVPAPSSGIPGGGFQAKTNYILREAIITNTTIANTSNFYHIEHNIFEDYHNEHNIAIANTLPFHKEHNLKIRLG